MEIIYKSYLQNILSHIADTMLQGILKDSEIGVDNREIRKESVYVGEMGRCMYN